MERYIHLDPRPVVRFQGTNRSTAYARAILEQLGGVVSDVTDRNAPLIVAGESAAEEITAQSNVVRLWDFQVGMRGNGIQASVASAVSCVIGLPGRPPLALPSDIPEKWCALLGVSIAMSFFVERANSKEADAPRRVVDISSADILRGFADQNFANHKLFPQSWSRNGRVTPNHGGIYPQGFFRCKDGYLAIVGRSRADWKLILHALGDPEWATGDLLDPVLLAKRPELVDSLFERELARFTRDELLDAALQHGATLAPVYTAAEAREKALVPADLFDGEQGSRLPFSFRPLVNNSVPASTTQQSVNVYS